MKHKLKKDVQISTLGEFKKGTEVTILKKFSSRCKVNVNGLEFFISETDLVKCNNSVVYSKSPTTGH